MLKHSSGVEAVHAEVVHQVDLAAVAEAHLHQAVGQAQVAHQAEAVLPTLLLSITHRARHAAIQRQAADRALQIQAAAQRQLAVRRQFTRHQAIQRQAVDQVAARVQAAQVHRVEIQHQARRLLLAAEPADQALHRAL
ncbi:MAG: hypothetical protein JST80_07490 [Bdellovibrionales bacterium]|nr:hypothetical protein [Bdellovibrionales bacterium]